MANFVMFNFVDPVSLTPLYYKSGWLVDSGARQLFPVLRGIPRFCPADNYSESFGFQWNWFDRTQLDVHSGADQAQQAFWLGADAGEEQMTPGRGATAACVGGDHFDNPCTARPVRFDVGRSLFCSHRQGDFTALPYLVMRCSKRDLALPSLE
jgi:hypothetical protein